MCFFLQSEYFVFRINYITMFIGEKVRVHMAVDLFCGAGGMTQGLKNAGFSVIGAVEIEPVACETYRMNHSETTVVTDDIRKIDCSDFMQRLNLKQGELDLLAGCPPCQGFSSMRTKNGAHKIEDQRNDLVFEFVRFTKELLPKYVLMENVPGLAKDNRIKEVLKILESLGYYINKDTVQVINAADYGVPQRRRRMILCASRVQDFTLNHTAFSKKTVRDAIENLPKPGFSGDPLHDILEKRQDKTVEMIKLIPKDGGSRSDLPVGYHLPCHIRNPKCFKDVYGRMKWDTVSPTITGGCINPSKGRFLHPEQDRAITLREAALLQTFPGDYKFSFKKGRDGVALMIGNALPPLFIQRHAEQILYCFK